MTDLNWLVSGSAHDINWWQMSVRAIVVFLYGLVVIRVAGRRAFGKNSAIDIVLAIIIGSSLGRALTGNAALPPTLVAMTALALLHEVLARLCVHWKWLGYLMKGEARQIVRGGQTNSATMKFKSLSDGDLIEAVRLHGRLTAVGDVKEAHLDLNGQISGLEKP